MERDAKSQEAQQVITPEASLVNPAIKTLHAHWFGRNNAQVDAPDASDREQDMSSEANTMPKVTLVSPPDVENDRKPESVDAGWLAACRAFVADLNSDKPHGVLCLTGKQHPSELSSLDVVCPFDSTLQLAGSERRIGIFVNILRGISFVAFAAAGFLKLVVPLYLLFALLAFLFYGAVTRHHPRTRRYLGVLGFVSFLLSFGYYTPVSPLSYLPAFIPALAALSLAVSGAFALIAPGSGSQGRNGEGKGFAAEWGPALLTVGLMGAVWWLILGVSIGGWLPILMRWTASGAASMLGIGLLIGALLRAVRQRIELPLPWLPLPPRPQARAVRHVNLPEPEHPAFRPLIRAAEAAVNSLYKSLNEVERVVVLAWHRIRIAMRHVLNALHQMLCVLWMRTQITLYAFREQAAQAGRGAVNGVKQGARIGLAPIACSLVSASGAFWLAEAVYRYIHHADYTMIPASALCGIALFLAPAVAISLVMRSQLLRPILNGLVQLAFLSLPFLIILSWSLIAISHFWHGPFKPGPLTILTTLFYVGAFIYSLKNGRVTTEEPPSHTVSEVMGSVPPNSEIIFSQGEEKVNTTTTRH